MARKGKSRSRSTSSTELDHRRLEAESQSSDIDEHFIPQEDDEDNLYEVVEILAEKGDRYLIKWAGVDGNGKPWENSWVPRRDVTDDLVRDWNKKAEKKREKNEKRRKGSKGKMSGGKVIRVYGKGKNTMENDRYVPQKTTSTAKRDSRSSRDLSTGVSTTSTGANVQVPPRTLRSASLAGSSATHPTSPVQNKQKRKRKRELEDDGNESNGRGSREEVSPQPADLPGGSSRPGRTSESPSSPRKKKRILEVEIPPSPKVARRPSRVQREDADEGTIFVGSSRSPSLSEVIKPKNKRRKRKDTSTDEDREVDEGDVDMDAEPKVKRRIWDLARAAVDSGLEGTREEDEEVTSARKRVRPLVPARNGHDKNSMKRGGSRNGSRGHSRTRQEEPLFLESDLHSEIDDVEGDGDGNGDGDDDRRIKKLNSRGKELGRGSKTNIGPLRKFVSSSSHDDREHSVDDLDELPFSQVEYDDFMPNPLDDFVEVRQTSHFFDPSQQQDNQEEREPHPQNEQSSKGTIIPETQSSRNNNATVITSSSSIQVSSQIQDLSETAEDQDEGRREIQLSNTVAREKRVGPIPYVSPSKFKPFVSVRPLSLFAPKLQQKPVQDIGNEEQLPSSIESNFSPIKRPAHVSTLEEMNVVGMLREDAIEDESVLENSRVDDLPDSSLVKTRGAQLAEKHRQEKRRAENTVVIDRKPLSQIIRSRRSDSPMDEDEEIVKMMQDEYVDFGGGTGLGAEEGGEEFGGGVTSFDEHASDHELEVEYAEGNAHGDVVEESSVADEDDVEPSDEDASRNILDAPLGGEGLGNDLVSGNRRTRSPTTSASRQGDDPYTPPQQFKIIGSPRKTNDVTSPLRQLESALGMLKKKSEEINLLRAGLLEGEEQRRTLLEQNAQLEADLAIFSQQRTQEPPTILTDADRDRVQNLTEELAALVRERDELLAENRLLIISKREADKDVEVLRETYAKASAYTDDLRNENIDLKVRLSLAETQVANGIKLVRAQFEARVKRASEELEKSKTVVKILEEKDRRTGDDIRKKASMLSELHGELEKEKEAYRDLKKDVNTILSHRNNLLVEKHELSFSLDQMRSDNAKMKDEKRHLRFELLRYAARERSVMSAMHLTRPTENDFDAEGELGDPGEDDVFVCGWTLNDSDKKCGEAFASRQALQDHMFLSNGHL